MKFLVASILCIALVNGKTARTSTSAAPSPSSAPVTVTATPSSGPAPFPIPTCVCQAVPTGFPTVVPSGPITSTIEASSSTGEAITSTVEASGPVTTAAPISSVSASASSIFFNGTTVATITASAVPAPSVAFGGNYLCDCGSGLETEFAFFVIPGPDAPTATIEPTASTSTFIEPSTVVSDSPTATGSAEEPDATD